jgi:hypothetical protein
MFEFNKYSSEVVGVMLTYGYSYCLSCVGCWFYTDRQVVVVTLVTVTKLISLLGYSLYDSGEVKK